MLYPVIEDHRKKIDFCILYSIEGNGYETRERSLLYVFVVFFDLDYVQNTIVVCSALRM